MRDEVVLAGARAIYLDASAIVKLEFEEPDSGFVRMLVLGSLIPIFCSQVGLGEFFRTAGRKARQQAVGSEQYLYSTRALLIDIEIGRIRYTEPVQDRLQFVQLARDLADRYSSLGGGDIWHLMALKECNGTRGPAVLFSYDRRLVKAAISENCKAVDGYGLDMDLLVSELKKVGQFVGDS